jgi:tripartite-type tricarboxylate transporter receptor subunit TctC
MKWTTAIRLSAAFVLSTSATAFAQDTYPSKPIRLIVPFAPGGGTDTLSRIVAQGLSENLGQQVVVENRPGAGGAVGAELAAKAPADGYTLYVGSSATSMLPGLYKNLSFDVVKDFVPIAVIGTSPFIIVVPTGGPVTSLPEMIALAKAKPGTLTYGSAGNGSVNHIGTELFKSMAGVDIQHVPYKGTAAALADLLGGRLTMLMDTVVSAVPNIRANRVRALAVTSNKRSSLVPDLPTVSELGPAGYDMDVWYAFVARAGTPEPIVRRLNTEINKVLASPSVRERYAGLGAEPASTTPEDMQKLWTAEEKKWTDVIRKANIRAD